MAKIKIRNRFDRERRTVRMAPTTPKLLTQQQFKDEADINLIVKRAEKTLQPPTWVNPKQPQFGDFSNVPSLAEAYELVAQAEESFMALPSAARLELNNDPRRLLEVDEDFLKRHGFKITKPTAPSGGVDGESEGGTPSGDPKPPKGGSKAPKGAPKPPSDGGEAAE